MKAQWCRYRLDFNFTAITSRQAMQTKDTWFVRVEDGGKVSYGECALFRGLSADDRPDYEAQLTAACRDPQAALAHPYSSIRFGFEQALLPAPVSAWRRGEQGIAINGLIWMADRATMASRITRKLDEGYKVLKLKIGGIDFDDELSLIKYIRSKFAPSTLEIRLDANGHYTEKEAEAVLEDLAPLHIHSIEQPIAAGQPEAMRRLCAATPIPIALDEEIIGTRTREESRSLLEEIHPQYIILKPALCGGFGCADTYIELAERLGIGWWATSALESNIGLEAIGAWVGAKKPTMPQGLGTGQLYTNNIPSALRVHDCALWRDGDGEPQSKMETLTWRS